LEIFSDSSLAMDVLNSASTSLRMAFRMDSGSDPYLFRENAMMFLRTLILAAFLFGSLPAWADDAVYYLFRHAEKTREAEDPGLTPEGQARAENLAAYFMDKGVTRIFSSDTRRTRDTVGPLAEILGLEIELYDPRNLEEFAERLKTMDGVIVISGHSNTTPELTALLSGQATEAMPESEYDRLYVVIRSGRTFMVVKATQE